MVEPVPLFLAPMAGVTDLAYRLLALETGGRLDIHRIYSSFGTFSPCKTLVAEGRI